MAESIKQELLSLERRYWKAIQDRDMETAMSLTDYPCIIAGAQGVGRIDRESYKKIMESANYVLHQFEVKDDAEVRMVTENVAILAYKVRESLTVEGKAIELDAADSSTWVRRNGRWFCAMHTESLVGDPYGRDRKAA